jgi:sialic acid synthase SpsE
MNFKEKFKVGNKWVGEGCPVFVIAEAGSNHDGSLSRAKKLIDVAAEVGADAIKFQSYTADGLVNPVLQPNVYKIIEKIATPAKWLEPLAEHAKKRGVVFLSTPFDNEQLERLEGVGVAAYKIASGDLTNLPFIRAIAAKKKPIFMSVGCGDMADVSRAVETVASAGNNRLVLLQCVVTYPTEWKDANIAVLHTLHGAFGCPVGYSDHSFGDLVPMLAAANGACVIEKHLTFDRFLPGPDHPFAMEIPEFKDMAGKLRAVGAAMGFPVKKVLKCECEETFYARRAIYAKHDIEKGEKITSDMIVLLRPMKGLAPGELERVLGRRAAKNIKAFSPIMWDCV